MNASLNTNCSNYLYFLSDRPCDYNKFLSYPMADPQLGAAVFKD